MKINEIVLHSHKKTWDMIKADRLAMLVNQLYDFYDEFLLNTKRFSIPADKIFNQFQITDLIIDYSNYKKTLLTEFNQTDQVIGIVDRIISYLDYNELS
jgi:hypothetical protein